MDTGVVPPLAAEVVKAPAKDVKEAGQEAEKCGCGFPEYEKPGV